MVLVMEVNLDQYIFGKILSIFIGTLKTPYFIFKSLTTVGFDSHFHAYQIESNSELEIAGCYLTELPNLTPNIITTIGNGTQFVTLRYAL